jgi:hypothetical protein
MHFKITATHRADMIVLFKPEQTRTTNQPLTAGSFQGACGGFIADDAFSVHILIFIN